jgi:4-amino-4-deoxy-L-arabinose transferase-like glycosyltransferase
MGPPRAADIPVAEPAAVRRDRVTATLLSRARRIDYIALLLVALGVALRLAWVLNATVAPVDDARFYFQHATDLAAGNGYIHPITGAPTAFLPPGYSLLLALVFAVTGPSALAGALLNVALAALGLGFAYGLARLYFGVNAARLVVGVLALFPSQIVYTPALLPDILLTTLSVGALFVGLAPGAAKGRSRWIVCGLLLAGAFLTAPKAALLLPALVLAWKPGRTWRAVGVRTGWVAVAMAAAVAPWSIWATAELGAPVLGSTNGGVNFWIGNNPDADGGWMSWDGTGTWTIPEDEIATDDSFLREGLEYAANNPVATLQIWPNKLNETFEQDFSYVGHFSLVARDRPLPPWSDDGRLELIVYRYYLAFCWLSVAGWLILLASRHRSLVLGWPALAVVAPIMLFFGLDRFHVPLLPLMAIGIAGGAEVLFERVQTRFKRPAAVPRRGASSENDAEPGAVGGG